MGRQLDKSQVGGGVQTEAEINYTPTETGSFRRSRPLRPRLPAGFEITRLPALTRPPASPCEGILRKEAGDPPQRPRGPDSKPRRVSSGKTRWADSVCDAKGGCVSWQETSPASYMDVSLLEKELRDEFGLGDAFILRALPCDTRDSCRITRNNMQRSQVHCLPGWPSGRWCWLKQSRHGVHIPVKSS